MPYEPLLVERLKDAAEAAAYSEAVLEEGDQAALMLALRQVAQARGGVAQLAELRSLNAVLKATGLRISVKPIERRPH